jgi:hypothetical protein
VAGETCGCLGEAFVGGTKNERVYLRLTSRTFANRKFAKRQCRGPLFLCAQMALRREVYPPFGVVRSFRPESCVALAKQDEVEKSFKSSFRFAEYSIFFKLFPLKCKS